MEQDQNETLVSLTAEIVSSFVANNRISTNEVADLIRNTHDALGGLGRTAEPDGPQHSPAVSVRASLKSKDHIVSLIDGKPYKMLKRHLQKHGLTPEQYRERFNLPANYPMVASAYAEARRDLARTIGLGRKAALQADESESESEPEQDVAPRRSRTRSKAKA
ncbi:transcriptional regulator [Sphingomonas oleivorans]|uniref:Transcriptional regulator n=1 Tax=Sphingomonas oleivorans TaxID=1735121 RepID=A0A2T5FY55_9SPHN|nr:MucR family transcriptional regulator [Sphingomonas oleivorans]PTQ11463.1 transcriptional regulator [Sphingomonas oleivorans]